MSAISIEQLNVLAIKKQCLDGSGVNVCSSDLQVAAQQSGYGTYQYYIRNLDQSQNQVVSKEAYWITVGTYGAEWRLVIWHALNP
jgi:hypothetical protein